MSKKFNVCLTMIYNGWVQISAETAEEAIKTVYDNLDTIAPDSIFSFGEKTVDFATIETSTKVLRQTMTLEEIKRIYHVGDLCMGELLATVLAEGLDLERAFQLYMEAIKWAEGDKFFRQIHDDPLEAL